jgi:spermidine synthase
MIAEKGLCSLAWLLGLLSTTVQVVLIRELLVAFTGNELTIAIALAFWLLSVAAGCLLARAVIRKADALAVAGGLLIIAGPAGVLQVISIRLLRPAFAGIGEVIGPAGLLALCSVGVLPCGLVLGALFVMLVTAVRDAGIAGPVARVYGLEAVGAGVAGLALTLWGLEHLDPFRLLAIATLAGWSGGVLTLRPATRNRARGLVLSALCLTGALAVFTTSGWIDSATRQVQWVPLKVAATADSKYARITVTRRDGTHDVFVSGSYGFSVPDLASAEECAHVPMLHHPAPAKVLLLGGAGSGALREIARHPTVTGIDFVELDPAVIGLVRGFADPGWLDIEGVDVRPIFGDGRQYVSTTAENYDVILINTGLPSTLQVNRFYTIEFFRQAADALTEGGIVGLRIPAGGAYIGPETAAMLSGIVNACRDVFRHVSVIPGDYIHVVCSHDREVGARTADLGAIADQRDLSTSYVNSYTLWDRLSPFRRARLDTLLATYGQAPLNTDQRPVSPIYAVSLWAKHFGASRPLMALASVVTPPRCLLGLAAIALVTAAILMRIGRLPLQALPYGIALYSMGYITMFTQILVLFALQVSGGYVYGRVAAIVAAFMAGLGISAAVLAGGRERAPKRRSLPVLQALLSTMPLAVILMLRLLATGHMGAGGVDVSLMLAPAALATGLLGGSIFAGASGALMAWRGASVGGAVSYSLDLSGACLSGLTTGFLIVPALGLAGSAHAVAAFGLLGLIALAFAAGPDRIPPAR